MHASRSAGARRHAAPAAAGLAAIVGHIYPVWLRFRGGKGVATACGVFSVLTPAALAPAVASSSLTVWLTRFVSLGSLVATVALGPIAASLDAPAPVVCRRVGVGAAVIVFRHRSNLARLEVGHRTAHRPAGAPVKQVAVLGAGSWGTALAVHLARAGASGAAVGARPGARRRDGAPSMRTPPICTDAQVPGVGHADGVLERALEDADLVVCAVPSHGVARVMRARRRSCVRGATVVSATKGLEVDTLLRVVGTCSTTCLRHALRRVLSGPSFAAELARQMPTAVCVASADRRRGRARAGASSDRRYLRLYASDDVVGVEIGGALKNVIAIAAGVVEGLGIGHNALAALITRGLAEIGRLATALGGRRETLAGLAGLGDLVLTCTGSLSRNRHVGIELARGRALAEIVGSMKMVAEGVQTTGAALALGARAGIELPIATQMAEVLAGAERARRCRRADAAAAAGRGGTPGDRTRIGWESSIG